MSLRSPLHPLRDNDGHLFIPMGAKITGCNDTYTNEGVLGQGTFGRVIQVRSSNHEEFAIKIYKNQEDAERELDVHIHLVECGKPFQIHPGQ